MIVIQRERERQRHRLLMWGAHVELYPRAPGSLPEPQADAQSLSHPGAPTYLLRHGIYKAITFITSGKIKV